jgi:hypothetical protein
MDALTIADVRAMAAKAQTKMQEYHAFLSIEEIAVGNAVVDKINTDDALAQGVADEANQHLP